MLQNIEYNIAVHRYLSEIFKIYNNQKKKNKNVEKFTPRQKKQLN